MTPVLSEATLYIGDNGRVFCGRVHCAGASARFTGRDLSGQPVDAVTAEDIAEWNAVAAPTLGAMRCDCGQVTADA